MNIWYEHNQIHIMFYYGSYTVSSFDVKVCIYLSVTMYVTMIRQRCLCACVMHIAVHITKIHNEYVHFKEIGTEKM